MEKKFNISDLNEIDIQHILNGLAELPAKISFNLIVKIDHQIKNQQVVDSVSENKRSDNELT